MVACQAGDVRLLLLGQQKTGGNKGEMRWAGEMRRLLLAIMMHH